MNEFTALTGGGGGGEGDNCRHILLFFLLFLTKEDLHLKIADPRGATSFRRGKIEYGKIASAESLPFYF